MRRAQVFTWVLGGIGTALTVASLVYGATANSFKGSLDVVTARQNAQDAVILKLTEIETQNATLLKIYGEEIKVLQGK